MIIAGIDVNEMNKDAHLLQSISEVIANFDPHKEITEDDNKQTEQILTSNRK